jgi:hypothetical protein
MFVLIAAAITISPLAAQSCPGAAGSGNPCVLTGQNNNHRDSYNNNEIHLRSDTVSSAKQVLLDGNGHTLLRVDTNDLPPVGSDSHTAVANPIYSQPLYVAGMSVASPANTANCNNNTTCNMVIASTLNGTLFAWNADNGAGLWARYGTCNGGAGCQQSGLLQPVGNAFWWDDCGGLGSSPKAGVTSGGPLQFLGNVSTGVIDTTYAPSSTTAVMYVTSYCQYLDSNQSPHGVWFLHEVDLKTGLDVSYNSLLQHVQINPTASCSNYADSGDGGCFNNQITFDTYGTQNQRPALLEVSDSHVTPNHLIYIAFGGFEYAPGTYGPYHGWLVAYTTDSNGVIGDGSTMGNYDLRFNSSTKGPIGNGDTPPCQSLLAWPGDSSKTFGTSQYANHCGFWTPYWQSGRGAAATNYGDLDNAIDVFIGSGDGAFQANAYNSGGLARFQVTSSGVGQTPYQRFAPFGDIQWQPSTGTPSYGNQICGPAVSGITQSGYSYTPCNPPIQPPQVDSACSVYPTGSQTPVNGFCQHTFEVENNNDWDGSIGGETLFYNGIDGKWEIITMNKDGISQQVISATEARVASPTRATPSCNTTPACFSALWRRGSPAGCPPAPGRRSTIATTPTAWHSSTTWTPPATRPITASTTGRMTRQPATTRG